ncbi:MAG: SRPBCC family protein [Hyphomicrobiaceae bacterium]
MKVLKLLAALASIAACGIQTAGAVEVRQAAEIKAAPAAVWAKVGEWCAIKDWHPAVASCQPGKRGFRTLTLKDGGKILEKVTKTGKNTYSYDIIESPLPVKNYKATLTAKADSLGTTDLVWTAKFDAAKGKSDADAAAVINGIFQAGLTNIKSNVKFDAPASPSPAAATAGTVVAADASKAISAAAARDEARLKAREERRKRLEVAKLAAMEKFAKTKVMIAEKAKAAAEAAKAAYEKAKAAMTAAPQPKKP